MFYFWRQVFVGHSNIGRNSPSPVQYGYRINGLAGVMLNLTVNEKSIILFHLLLTIQKGLVRFKNCLVLKRKVTRPPEKITCFLQSKLLFLSCSWMWGQRSSDWSQIWGFRFSWPRCWASSGYRCWTNGRRLEEMRKNFLIVGIKPGANVKNAFWS